MVWRARTEPSAGHAASPGVRHGGPCCLALAAACCLTAAGCSKAGRERTAKPAATTAPVAAGPVESRPAATDAGAGPGSQPAADVTVEQIKAEAADVARRLLLDLTEDANALALAGETYVGLGRSGQAALCWRMCLKVNPAHAGAYHRLGWAALRRGDAEEAVTLLARAARLDPRLPHIHRDLGSAMLQEGRPAEGVVHLERAVRLAPGEANSRCLLGQAYQLLKQYDLARQSYEAAVKAQPDHKNACYGLAVVLGKLGHQRQADEWERKYQQLNRASLRSVIEQTDSCDDAATMRQRLVVAHIRAGIMYAAHRRGSDAEAHWRRAAALDGSDVGSRALLATWYQARGREQEALRLCERLTAMEPNNSRHWVNLGLLHARLARLPKAEEALRKAIRLAPRDAGTHAALASVFLRAKKKLAEARRLAAAAVKLAPTAPNHALLAQAHRANGDLESAKAAAKAAIAADPTDARYKQVLRAIEGGR